MKMVKKNIHISMNTRVIVDNPSKIISSSLVKGKQVEDTKVIQKTADQTIKNLRITYFTKNELLFCIFKKYYVSDGGVC